MLRFMQGGGAARHSLLHCTTASWRTAALQADAVTWPAFLFPLKHSAQSEKKAIIKIYCKLGADAETLKLE